MIPIHYVFIELHCIPPHLNHRCCTASPSGHHKQSVKWEANIEKYVCFCWIWWHKSAVSATQTSTPAEARGLQLQKEFKVIWKDISSLWSKTWEVKRGLRAPHSGGAHSGMHKAYDSSPVEKKEKNNSSVCSLWAFSQTSEFYTLNIRVLSTKWQF